MDINKIVVSNKSSFNQKGFKCCVDYKIAKKQTFRYTSPKNEGI